jgi:transposase-like protein
MNYKELCSCHEEKKRCPSCLSLNTKKNGIIKSNFKTARGLVSKQTQRFICIECKISFTSHGLNIRKKVSDSFKKEIVNDYVISKSSLRDVARRYNIGKSVILNWLDEISTSFPEIKNTMEYDNDWSGIILLDGKEIKNNGEKRTIFIAADAMNKKPISYMICDRENKNNAKRFLNELKQIYPVKIKGITTDFGKGKCFLNVVSEIFPNIPHQICLVHYSRYVWLFIPRTRRSEYFFRNKMLKYLIKRIIFAGTKVDSKLWLDKLNYYKPFFRARYHEKFIKSVNRNYKYLTARYQNNFLPTNTNVIENIIRQLERKLKNMDGIKSIQKFSCLLKIWFYYYKINHS